MQHRPPDTSRKRTGFSLVEMVVVMAIIGIVAVAALAEVVRRKPQADLNRAAWEITTELRRCRTLAVSRNATCEMDLDTSDNTITAWVDLDKDGVVDGGEETITDLSDINGLFLRQLPSTPCSFDARGHFDNGTDAYGFKFIIIQVPDVAAAKVVHLYASGQVDLTEQ